MGGVLLGWGLKDAAPFVFFSTREEVAAREQMVSERATGTKLADLKQIALGLPCSAVSLPWSMRRVRSER